MEKKYLLILGLIIIGIYCGNAQVLPTVLDKNNQKIKEIAKNVDEAGWVFLKKEKKLASDDIFVKYKEAFGLGKNDEMKLVNIITDDIEMNHYTYQQYYKGLRVEHFTYRIHEKDGIAEIANGELLENLDLDISPSLNLEKTLSIALSNFKSNKWAWEDKDWENEKKSDKANPSWKPNGELLIIEHMDGKVKMGVLVYKFELRSITPDFYNAIYINANTGQVEKNVSLKQAAEGSVNTLYNGIQDLTTLYRGLPNWDYILKDETRGYICTKMYSAWSWNLTGHIDNQENYWHESGNEVNGATAQWCAEKAYDFYHYAYGRYGIDGNNLDLRVEINPNIYNNAYWVGEGADHDLIQIGWVGEYNYLATLDIIGHEYTHGVVSCGSNLVYEKEPGALNESFADIFGTMVERYVESSTWNWTIGEDLNILRSMSSPHDYNQPSTYLESGYWEDVTSCTPDGDPNSLGYNDFCYVHKNAGVQNYWFYLLSNGGTQNNVTVTSIGVDNSAKIAYYTMLYYLSSQSGYSQARSASISAASYLFGMCSTEYQQVKNAWAAVNVGTPATDPCIVPLTVDISGNYDSNCGNYEYYSSDVTGGNGNYSYQWYVNYEPVSSSSTLNYYFPEYVQDTYYISLLVTDGEQNEYADMETYVYCGEYIMENENSIKMSVYPNPATDQTTIRILDDKKAIDDFVNSDYNISIVDNSGRVLYKTKTKSNELNINLGGYQKGTYSLIITRGKYKGSSLIIKK